MTSVAPAASAARSNGARKPARAARKDPAAPAGDVSFPGEVIQPGNIELRWDGRRLIVAIDCGPAACRAAVPSKSGKSRILASTSGFWSIPVDEVAGLQLSLTATLPAK